MTSPVYGSPSDSPRYVFVYGTLRRGEVNDINELQPAPGFVGHSSLLGTLYPMGWYPGLVLGGVVPVVGEVYSVTPRLEARLDEIEGLLPEPTGEYTKRDMQVDVDGRMVDCFVYEINAALVGHLQPLIHGDWLRRDEG